MNASDTALEALRGFTEESANPGQDDHDHYPYERINTGELEDIRARSVPHLFGCNRQAGSGRARPGMINLEAKA
jgi:hypothetical protein